MITFLIPTYNEKNNIFLLVNTLINLKLDFKFNILFVDDNSNDGSLLEFNNVKKKFDNVDFIIRKEKKRDLTQSLLKAFGHIKDEYTFILDCDLQHDYNQISETVRMIFKEEKDLIIGSRFLNKNQDISLSKKRLLQSKFGIFLCKFLGIKKITDPLSGFFLIKTKFLLKIRDQINTRGFKILLTILYLHKNNILLKEIPIIFNQRKFGKSKLNFRVKLLFLEQIIRLKFYR